MKNFFIVICIRKSYQVLQPGTKIPFNHDEFLAWHRQQKSAVLRENPPAQKHLLLIFTMKSLIPSFTGLAFKSLQHRNCSFLREHFAEKFSLPGSKYIESYCWFHFPCPSSTFFLKKYYLTQTDVNICNVLSFFVTLRNSFHVMKYLMTITTWTSQRWESPRTQNRQMWFTKTTQQ